MPPGTGFPVDSTVIVPFHILFYLLEFSLMSYSPDLLDTQFCKIIAHSKQFITMKHQIGRIYFYLLPFTAGQTTLYQPQAGRGKHTDHSEIIYTAMVGTQIVNNRLCLSTIKGKLETNITLLKDYRYFIYYRQMDRERITALHS